jgi:hypothetical protein
VLDTLLAMRATYFGNILLGPTMTVYHGHDLARPFVFTGFAPWLFKRVQCSQLFDFVLRDLWGMQRHPVTANVAVHRSTAPAARR